MNYRLRPQHWMLILLLLGGAGVALETFDWRLVARSVTYPEAPITQVDWYRPLDPVPGDPGAPLPTARAAEHDLPKTALQHISAYAAARNSTALLVMHRGRIVWEQYWRDFSPDARFNGMSMAKTILSLLLGIAIAEGHIDSVHDPVADYLPEWRQDARGHLTIEDLLYMQSGLRNDDRTDTLFSDLVQMYGGSDVAAIALNVPLVEPPGETFRYNNVNSQILGLLLERATRETYADYLSSRLWQPLQARDAAVWLDRPNGHAKTFCCLFATPRDWLRVGQLLLQRGRVGAQQVVPAAWIERMLEPSPLEPTFGYFIWLKARTADYPNVNQAATVPFLAEDTFYLDGRGHQRVYVIPSRELVIVRAGETPPNWDDAVIPNTLVRSLR